MFTLTSKHDTIPVKSIVISITIIARHVTQSPTITTITIRKVNRAITKGGQAQPVLFINVRRQQLVPLVRPTQLGPCSVPRLASGSLLHRSGCGGKWRHDRRFSGWREEHLEIYGDAKT
ncbi:hypothetical protein E2C01_038495 [Portunus trituberculatus]|uniref:Uncharacterized protein n=1 Tax=Portunus trituberculatus TaxID=210409 RepID=A0A5B7FH00_PORTR|nr:hypothetical protein [Portunus trituberculatus]